MIRSISIENYKNLNGFQLDSLGAVNLITGCNNRNGVIKPVVISAEVVNTATAEHIELR